MAAPSLEPIRSVINLTNFSGRHTVPGAVPNSGPIPFANSGHSVRGLQIQCSLTAEANLGMFNHLQKLKGLHRTFPRGAGWFVYPADSQESQGPGEKPSYHSFLLPPNLFVFTYFDKRSFHRYIQSDQSLWPITLLICSLLGPTHTHTLTPQPYYFPSTA